MIHKVNMIISNLTKMDNIVYSNLIKKKIIIKIKSMINLKFLILSLIILLQIKVNSKSNKEFN